VSDLDALTFAECQELLEERSRDRHTLSVRDLRHDVDIGIFLYTRRANPSTKVRRPAGPAPSPV
jgi:hypothetical protein